MVATMDLRTQIAHPGATLAARLLVPSAARPPAVIFVHGLGSGKDSPRNVVIAEHLRDAGIAALLFDLSGHGESSPRPARDDELQAYEDDLAAAFAWLRARADVDGSRIGVAGSSLGGIVALRALRDCRITPASLVLRAPPVGPHDLEAVPVPALVIVGSLDPLASQVQSARRSPHVRVRIIEGAGHLFDEPGALQEALDATVTWFRDTLAGRQEES